MLNFSASCSKNKLLSNLKNVTNKNLNQIQRFKFGFLSGKTRFALFNKHPFIVKSSCFNSRLIGLFYKKKLKYKIQLSYEEKLKYKVQLSYEEKRKYKVQLSYEEKRKFKITKKRINLN